MPDREIPTTPEVRALLGEAVVALHRLAHASGCLAGGDVFAWGKEVSAAVLAADVEDHRRGRSDG